MLPRLQAGAELVLKLPPTAAVWAPLLILDDGSAIFGANGPSYPTNAFRLSLLTNEIIWQNAIPGFVREN